MRHTARHIRASRTLTCPAAAHVRKPLIACCLPSRSTCRRRVAAANLFTLRITPTGDLYVGRMKAPPPGLTSTPPSFPATAQGAAAMNPPPANATQGHRKLLQGNIVGRDDR